MLFFGFYLLALATANDFVNIVNEINNDPNATWTAEVPARFGSFDDAKTLCGAWTKGHPNYIDHDLEVFEADGNDVPSFDEGLDARTKWKNCTVISKIRDQSACGSCWAFGSTETFEDSRCIHTGEDIAFSADDTAGCCTGRCGHGCSGGQPTTALSWMHSTGVVTGGDYPEMKEKSGGCRPYQFPPCAHHVPPSAKYPKCPGSEYSISCTRSCTSVSGKDYNSDKTKGSGAFSVRSASSIRSALASTGPLSVAFTVYQDFVTYKSGVYTHKSGSALGGHAVEMIGYGNEGGTDYWLVKNSWNEQWGDGGCFKIKAGVNECGIENDVTGMKF